MLSIKQVLILCWDMKNIKKPTKKEIDNYLITKYMGGPANNPPAKNIKFELEKGYEFGYKEFFGKKGITIKKIINENN